MAKEPKIKPAPAPVEEVVVEEPIVTTTDTDTFMDGQDIPFLIKPTREGRRDYNSNPKHAPVVEIAGKSFELRDVPLDEIKDLNVPISHDQEADVLASKLGGGGQTGSERWSSYHSLAVKDLNFKHVNIDGIDIYISAGSELIITNQLDSDHYWHDSVFGKPSSDSGALVVLASQIHADSLMLAGKNIIRNTTLAGNHDIRLIDADVCNSTLVSNTYSITIDDSSVTNVSFNSADSITVVDSNIYNARIYGVSGITFERVTGGHGFSMDISRSYGLGLRVINQFLHSFDMSSYNHKTTKGYEAIADYPSMNSVGNLTIDRRVDYGMFTAEKPVSFIRLNQYDLMVGDEVFSVKDFFPELLTNKEAPKLEEPRGGYGPFHSPMSYPSSYPGMYSRDSDLWKRASRIAFTKHKAVIGKMGESIVNGLLEQIKSRISLYIEISTVS